MTKTKEKKHLEQEEKSTRVFKREMSQTTRCCNGCEYGICDECDKTNSKEECE